MAEAAKSVRQPYPSVTETLAADRATAMDQQQQQKEQTNASDELGLSVALAPGAPPPSPPPNSLQVSKAREMSRLEHQLGRQAGLSYEASSEEVASLGRNLAQRTDQTSRKQWEVGATPVQQQQQQQQQQKPLPPGEGQTPPVPYSQYQALRSSSRTIPSAAVTPATTPSSSASAPPAEAAGGVAIGAHWQADGEAARRGADDAMLRVQEASELQALDAEFVYRWRQLTQAHSKRRQEKEQLAGAGTLISHFKPCMTDICLHL